jgi:hypothetical protein
MPKHKTPRPIASRVQPVDFGERLRRWSLAVAAALCVARPLLPSEAVAWLGDGQPFNMLWLSLAVVTLLAAVGGGGLRTRWTPTDVAVALLVGCYTTSAVWAAFHASPRPAVNMLWEWTALGLVYFLLRELAPAAAEQRALVGAMIALAVVLAVYGYYQYFVSMPADRLEFARDGDAMLRQIDEWYEPGSVERRQFESRLASTEPTATFALANSLAGYLATWLLMTIGIVASTLVAERARFARVLKTLFVVVLLTAGCLLLTKSRSAYLALAAGLALLPLSLPAMRQSLRLRHLGVIIAVALLLLIAGIAVRGLDSAVLTEAGKSLGYRLEYWQSTWAMIKDHPWLGCGPGNFQDYYTQYKLPQASEEVQDPHNLFFEVWATAGTPALLALVAALVCYARQVSHGGAAVAEDRAAQPTTQVASPPAPRAALLGVAGGAAGGFLLAHFVAALVGLEFGIGKSIAGLLIGAAVFWGLWPWIRGGRLSPTLAPLAVLVLTIHLLAAGGISFPGVADSFWILLALGVNQTAGAHRAVGAPQFAGAANRIGAPGMVTVSWPTIAAMALAGAGATACYLTAYGPVLRWNTAMSQAQSDEVRHDPRRQAAAYLAAGLADPLSAQSWQFLAQFDFENLVERQATPAAREPFEQALRMLLTRRPHSSSTYRMAAGWMLRLFGRTHDPEDAARAIEYFERAVELYPNSGQIHADFALALCELGKPNLARSQAETALALDAATPHADKRLSDELRAKLRSNRPAD